MKAKVTKAFPGRPDGEAVAREVAAGEEITGELAAYAVGAGLAQELKAAAPAKPAAKKPAKKG